jgi:tryptophan 2,3-dioxygenase
MQFRKLEVKLGLRRDTRLCYAGAQFDCSLTPEQMQEIKDLEAETSLFDLLDKWLSRMPVLNTADFSFWSQYKNSVYSLFREEKADLAQQLEQGRITADIYRNRLADMETQVSFFDAFFDEDKYNALREKGEYRLSYKACQAALMINFYQEEPLFQVPSQLLSLLIEIDAHLGAWRSKHAAMVHRMLGLKMGTGGSSGYSYLMGTVRHHRVFAELCNLASLMVPRCCLPPLPESVSRMTSFRIE